VPSEPLGILLISGNHERAHYAFVVAAGAAALGREVVLFATNEGCRALLSDWSSLTDASREAAVVARGVAGLAELREAAIEFGVRMIACEAGLCVAGIDPGALAASVEVAGVASFLEAVRGGQILTL
jgi:peroxiredoxin family protein